MQLRQQRLRLLATQLQASFGRSILGQALDSIKRTHSFDSFACDLGRGLLRLNQLPFQALWHYSWVKRAVEDAAPRKSPSAGLSHLACKSQVKRRDLHFSHRPCRDEQYFDFPA